MDNVLVRVDCIIFDDDNVAIANKERGGAFSSLFRRDREASWAKMGSDINVLGISMMIRIFR